MTSKFDYGDAVKVVAHAPTRYRPGSTASICGFSTIFSGDVAESMGETLGTELCLIEIHDGSAFDVPMRYLVKFDG